MIRNLTQTPSLSLSQIQQALRHCIKEDSLFWSVLLTLSAAMGIVCLHAACVRGFHDYYFSWCCYLLASPLILIVKLINQHIKLNLDTIEVMTKFTIGFSLAYHITPVLLTTPHPLIDHSLLYTDQLLHINTIALLTFTHLHTFFQTIMVYCYTRLDGSFMLLILLFTILNEKKMTRNLLTMSLIALFVAAITFYFFPALGPATVLHSPLFPQYAPIELTQYHTIQQGLPFDTSNFYSGFVSMPSIHCFIASVAIYACLACKKLRWYLLPLVLFNLGIIASTMFLGEHYLVDLIASEILLAILIGCYTLYDKKHKPGS